MLLFVVEGVVVDVVVVLFVIVVVVVVVVVAARRCESNAQLRLKGSSFRRGYVNLRGR